MLKNSCPNQWFTSEIEARNDTNWYLTWYINESGKVVFFSAVKYRASREDDNDDDDKKKGREKRKKCIYLICM